MRALRTSIGLLLVVAGVPMLIAATAGWTLMQHRDASGGFSASLAPVRSSGYAVVVPDLAELIDGHGATGKLGSGRIRISVQSSTGPLVIAVARAGDVSRYLDGVARSELIGVGFSAGAQPVDVVDVAGTAVPAPTAQQLFWAGTAPETIELDVPRSPGEKTSLVLMRSDGTAGIDATLTVGFYPGWLNAATWGLLLAGSVALLAGLVAVFFPARRREMVLVLEPHRMVDFADRIAQRLGAIRTPRLRRNRRRDLTGERITVPAEEEMASARQGRWRELDTYDGYADYHPEDNDPDGFDPDGHGPDGFGPDGYGDDSLDEEGAGRGWRLKTGESPYIYTAT